MSQATELAQLREKVLRLAREIESLSEADIPPDAFFPEFLNRLTAAVGARGAAVWLSDGGPIRLAYQLGLEESGFYSAPQATQHNDQLLREALSTGETKAYLPDETQLPTRHLYVVAPLSVAAEPVGVIEVLQRPETAASAKAGLLQFTEQMAGYASRYLTRQRDAGRRGGDGARARGGDRENRPNVNVSPSPPVSPSPKGGLPPAFWTDLEKFLLQLERSRTVGEVASTAASDGRILLNVDRVSIARKRGRKTPVEAISGQEKVNPRANLVRRMSALCKVVMAGREPLIYTGAVENLPPQLEQPLADYVAESNSRLVMIVPLFETGELVKPELEDKEKERRLAQKDARVIGCIVAEQINDSRVPPALHEKLDVTADHVAASLQRAITFERIFLRRTLLAIGRTGEWFHGRKLAKTLAIIAAVAAVSLALFFFPWPYKVVAEGRLMPEVQRDVFAPWDGEVTQLAVRGGEVVKAGDPLAVLRNDDLRAEQIRVSEELSGKRKAVTAIAGQIADRNSRQDQAQLEGELVAAQAEVTGLEKQLEILEERAERLKVTAPITGVVATFQLDQLLQNRPVRRGEVLMEVMDDKATWHLEVDVEDRRMGHILRAIQRKGDVGLPVEFVLATDPETRYSGTLKKIESRAQTDSELGNVVRVEIALDNPEALPRRRIGAEVRAKINTGDRALGYVLFGDVIDFVRKHLWL
ncbi:MAG: HlyD family efflux transporter periplasmic adaptor subunit [Planctomycetota bacterium]|nr:HlyD family efflux transporter periplasmic adaptor subunit [Planctomycetaceae bacterium]MDQ3331952.1 HlyD family efflux transporter periplasmic adaptor subunit [Planctomycetota bacterium]